MTPDFDIKFRNGRVAKAALGAFDAVNKQHVNPDRKKGAVFCQLKECDFLLLRGVHGDKVQLIGSYLPPKWAARVGRVLRAYQDELAKEKKNEQTV